MTIDKNSWHAVLYRAWYCSKHWGNEPVGAVNLCPYVRTVLFWAPLRLLFLGRVTRWLSWPALVGAAEYLLWLKFHHKLFEVELAVLAAVFLLATFVAIVGAAIWTGAKTKNAPVTKSFGRVLTVWYEGVHKHICPLVDIR